MRTFQERLNALKREVMALKTSHTKSMSAVKTTAQSVRPSFTLSSDPMYYNYGWAYIDVTTEKPNQLAVFELESLPDIEDRQFFIDRLIVSDTQFTFLIGIQGNSSDFQRIIAGETVVLTYNAKIRCTSGFTATVR